MTLTVAPYPNPSPSPSPSPIPNQIVTEMPYVMVICSA